MNYRYHTPRCPHGFSRQPKVPCYTCDGKTKRDASYHSLRVDRRQDFGPKRYQAVPGYTSPGSGGPR
jgi:hypothetical protein